MPDMTTYYDAHDLHVAKATRDAQGNISYSGGDLLGDMISMSVTPDVQTFTHVSEHAGKRSITKAYGANVTLNHEPIPMEKRGLLYGHELNEDDELADNIEDVPQGVGTVFYQSAMDGSFEGVFLPYVVFAEGTTDANVALEGPQFTSSTTTGVAEPNGDGDYRIRKRFTNKADVLAWMKAKLNITN